MWLYVPQLRARGQLGVWLRVWLRVWLYGPLVRAGGRLGEAAGDQLMSWDSIFFHSEVQGFCAVRIITHHHH